MKEDAHDKNIPLLHARSQSVNEDEHESKCGVATGRMKMRES